MPGRTSSFIALTIAAVLLLMSVSIDRSIAGHDFKEAWTAYQDACALEKVHKVRQERFAQLRERTRFYATVSRPDALHKQHVEINKKMELLFNKHTSSWLDARDLCNQARQNYADHLTDFVTEIVLTGSLPDPAATPRQNVKKPPHSIAASARRVRTNRRPPKPPQRGHSTSQTQALAVIGGIIIQGIQRGTRRGQRSGGKPSRGGGGGGGSSCSGGYCPP